MALIYLYDSHITDFTYNGQPLSKAYDVKVTHFINDEFYVTGKHPIDKDGTYKGIQKNKILKVHTPNGMQPFRIMNPIKTMDYVEFEAWPLLFADMRNKLVRPLALRSATLQQAISAFLANLLLDTPFVFTTNITSRHDYHTQDEDERENNPNQLYDALEVLKDLVTRWNGELIVNGYDIRIVDRMGEEKQALLYEKKNITSFIDKESVAGIVTRLHGKSEWTESLDGGETLEHSIQTVIDSPLIDAYNGIIFEKQYTNNDCRTEQELKNWLNLKFTTENIDKPSRNIELDTNIIDDEVINLGDGLVLKYLKHDVDMQIRMIGYEYDGYANLYVKTYLGDAAESFTGSLSNTVSTVQNNIEQQNKQIAHIILNRQGVKIVYSPIEPTGSFQDKDIWFDDQGGMYHYNSEAADWIPHPYNRRMDIAEQEIKKAHEENKAAKQAAESSYTNAVAEAERMTGELSAQFQADLNTQSQALSQDITQGYTNALTDANDYTDARERAVLSDIDARDTALRTEIATAQTTAINQAQTDIQTMEQALSGQLATLSDEVDDARTTADNAVSAIGTAVTNAGFATLDETLASIQTSASDALGTAGAAKQAADDLATQVSDFELTVNGFTQVVNDYEGQVAGFRNDVQGLNSTVAAYETQVDAYGNAVATYATEVSTLNNTVSGFDSTVASYERTVNGYTTQVSEFQNTVNGLNNTVAQYSEDVSGYSAQLSTLNNTISGFRNTVAAYESQVDDYTSAVNGYSAQVSGFENTLSGFQTTVANYQVEVDEYGNEVSRYATQVSTFQNTVNGLQTTVADKASQSEVTQLSRGLESVVTDFSNLEIGGRNYLLDSEKEVTFRGYVEALSLDASVSNKKQLEGRRVTVSFDMKHSEDSEPVVPHVYYRDYSGGYLGFSYEKNQKGTTTEYQRFEITIDENKTPINLDDYRDIYIRKNDNRNTVSLRRVKIEVGTQATDWTPAPEDMATESRVTQLADNINARIVEKGQVVAQFNMDNGTTLIQNNKLLLDANTYIMGTTFVNDIKAQSLEAVNANIGSLRTSILTTNVITADMLQTSTATIDKLFATTAAIDRLTGKAAFIEDIKAYSLEAVYADIANLRTNVLTANVITATHLNVDGAMIDKLMTNNLLANALVADDIVTNSMRTNALNTVTANIATIRSQVLQANVVTATHLKSDTALIDKIFASDANVARLTSKTAFISDIKAIDISADRITSGTLDAANINVINMNANSLTTGTINAANNTSWDLTTGLFQTTGDWATMQIHDGTIGFYRRSNGQYIGGFEVNHYTSTDQTQLDFVTGDRNSPGLRFQGSSIQTTQRDIDADLHLIPAGAGLVKAQAPSSGVYYGMDAAFYRLNNRSEVREGPEGQLILAGNSRLILRQGGGTYAMSFTAAEATLQRPLNMTNLAIRQVNRIEMNRGGQIYEVGEGQLEIKSNATLVLRQGGGAYVMSASADSVTFQRDIYTTGDIHLDNNERIRFKSPNGIYREDFYRGTDDWLHLNVSGQGRTKIHGNAEAKIVGSSDERLKTAITDSRVNALAEIKSIRFIDFEWDKTIKRNAYEPDGRQFGLSAQSAPFLQVEDEDGYLSVHLNTQVNLTMKAVQELAGIQDDHEERLRLVRADTSQALSETQQLKEKVEELEEKIKLLEAA